MKTLTPYSHQRGVTLIELMVAMGITMFLVTAASYVYLGTRETQRSIERTSSSIETGAFALQILGRDIMNAGFYPATMPPISTYSPTMRRFDSYPPGIGIPVRATDWISPAPVYLTGIFGCDGSKFDHVTATCSATVADAPDSIVINYFTNESVAFSNTVGQRRDCTGADVGNDPSNATRQLNSGPSPATAMNDNLSPQAPLFVSNRYGLNTTAMEVEKQAISTQSLACGGNGKSSFGVADTTAYQPLLAGIDDMQLTYGVFNTEATRAPDRFYTATEVNALLTVSIDGVPLAPWARVVAVRVCLMTRTLGENPKIADKAGAQRSYLDCADQTITQAATDQSIHKRHVQIFGVRNKLNQGF
ncbi:MAG: PilW family protein [Rhodoferax sp.]